ncbi:hydrolase [Lacticaseibacillus daqingensis]|uniref:hydrolase n=1 Tax=Lacticaseibacillus daqingensis TaxID=2486014 RepID=UPI000F7A9CCB
MTFIKITKPNLIALTFITVLGMLFAVYASTQPVEAIEQPTAAQHQINLENQTPAAKATAKTLVASQKFQAGPHVAVMNNAGNPFNETENRLAAEAAAKAAAEQAAQEAAAKAAAEAQAAAERAAQQAAAQKAAQAKAVQLAAVTTAGRTLSQTFKVTFYDPAVLGSSMGYGGIAANLGVLPRGTRVRIQMSNGQTLVRTVNDTGGFAAGNPYQIDVAMPNNQIPSAGVLSATITIL